MRRHLSADVLILLGLFLLPLAVFWQVTLGGRILLPADNLYQFQPYAAARETLGVPDVAHNMLLSDLVLENLEWKTFIRDSLSRGEIPLWNPHLFAGVPFLAAGQHSALYPFSLVYYVLPLEHAYGWFTVSQLWLAGAFMFAFLRGLGIRRAGAAIGAIAYQLSGFFLASVVFQMIIAAAAWLPFLLLMVEFTIQRRQLRGRPAMLPWVALGALGLGMTVLAGHVEFVYYSLLVMGFWAACRLVHLAFTRAQPLPQLARTSGMLIALVVLGLALGAVQIAPLYELVNSSSREGRATFDEVRSYALPPRHALTLLMPNIFGNPSQHEYFDVFEGRTTPIDWEIDGARVTDSMMPGGKNYVEGAAYVGILTLALAGVALLSSLNRRARWLYAGPYRAILAALAVVSLAFAFGTIAYGLLYYGLPGINQLHSPFRWIFPLTLCLAALAGFGVDAIQRRERQPSPPAPLSPEPPQGGPRFAVEGESQHSASQHSPLPPAVEGLGVRALDEGATISARIARWMGVGLIALGAATLALLVLSRVLFPQARAVIETLYTSLAGATLAYPSVEIFYSVKFLDVLIFALFAIASGIALLALRRPRGAWVAAGVLALDLVVASAGFNPAADPAWLAYEPPSLAWLRAQQPQEWRLTAVQGPSATLNANIPWLFGLQDIRGYDSIIPRSYVEYMERIQPQTQLLFNRIAPVFPDTLDALDSPWLDRLAVRYVMVETASGVDLAQTSGYREAYRDAAVVIYENPDAMPRAVLLDTARCTDADSAAPVASDARLAGASGVQVTVDVTVAEGAGRCLVLADSYAPGWRAYLRPQGAAEDQETELSITPVWDNFRGVELTPGDWSVRFRYSPPLFQIGAFTSFLALVSLLFGALLWAWRALSADGARQTGSGVQRFARNSLAPIALNLFNRGIDLAFAFIMLRLLGPANAGVYYYAVVIFGWFDILTNFGLNTLLTREVARDRASAGRFLLNSSLLRLGLTGLGIPLLVAFLIIRGALPPPLDGVSVAAIVLLYIGLIPGSISTGLSALFYAFEKAETPAAISTVTAILKAAFGLAVLAAGWGVLGLAAVSIVLNVITLAILAWSARGLHSATHTPARVDRRMMRRMMAAGWPLMLNHLLATIFFKIDVVLLEPLQGSTVVGQYSTAYKWLDALGVIPSLFTMALLPVMSRQSVEDRPGLERSYHLAVKLMFGLALPVAVATTFLAYPLINLLGGPRYLPDGAIALQLMVWFIPIGWINSLTNYVLIALDQQKAMRWAFLSGVSFNIVANLIFIPQYGYRAAAVVTILSEAVLLASFYMLLRKALAPVPWLGLLWKFGAAGLTMAAMMAVLWPVAPLLALILGGASYPLALIILRPFSAWERGRFAALLPGRATS